MNCRPGDMAVVVRIHGPENRPLLGRVVRVLRLYPDEFVSARCSETNVWEIATPFHVRCGGRKYCVNGLADAILQPIRGDTVDASKATGRELPNVVPAPV